MSAKPETLPSSGGNAWLMPALAAGVVVASVISYGRSEERQAAPGSPYYGKAVQEAIKGLTTAGAAVLPEGRPPLPAGLSPDDYYWCDTCKAYHRRDAAQGQPQGGVAPVAGAAIPSLAVAGHDAEAIPPLPAGLSPDDYYWCVNCKAYHPRQVGQATPAGWAGVPFKLPPVAAPHP